MAGMNAKRGTISARKVVVVEEAPYQSSPFLRRFANTNLDTSEVKWRCFHTQNCTYMINFDKSKPYISVHTVPTTGVKDGDVFKHLPASCWRDDFWPLWYQISRKSCKTYAFKIGRGARALISAPPFGPMNDHKTKCEYKKRKRTNHKKRRKPWQT